MKKHAKKAISHEVSVLGKTVPTLAVAVLFLAGTGTAALLTNFGTVTGDATVSNAAVQLDGQTSTLNWEWNGDGDDILGETYVETHTLSNNVDESQTVELSTSCSMDSTEDNTVTQADIDWSNECEGIQTRFVEYYDEAGTVGADLSNYSPPTAQKCDYTESSLSNVQELVDGDGTGDANSGETVCIESGSYKGTLSVDVADVTLAGKGQPSDTVINAQENSNPDGDAAVEVTASKVTVKGLKVTNSTDGEKGIRATGTQSDYLTDVSFKYLEVVDNGDRGAAFSRVKDSEMSNILVYGGHGTQGDKEGPSTSQSDGITFWRVDDSSMNHITARDNGDNGVYFNGNNNDGQNILVHGNGDEGVDISSDHEVDNSGSDYSSINGGTHIDFVTSYNNGDAAIEIEDNENEVNILNAEVYESPEGLLVGDNGDSAESDDANVVVEDSNFLPSNDEDIVNNGGATVEAANNYFGTDGIQTSGDVNADWETKQIPVTLDAEADDKFGAINSFAVNLVPASYNVTTQVQ